MLFEIIENKDMRLNVNILELVVGAFEEGKLFQYLFLIALIEALLGGMIGFYLFGIPGMAILIILPFVAYCLFVTGPYIFAVIYLIISVLAIYYFGASGSLEIWVITIALGIYSFIKAAFISVGCRAHIKRCQKWGLGFF
jgi:hypothetical protein